jgi:hypothetical protein
MQYMGGYVRPLCPCHAISWLICRFRLPSQLTRVPPTSIDLEPKELYNASRCAYIINVQPFPRREGNYAWAPFSALAVFPDNRSVETLTGRSPYYLSLMLHIHKQQSTLVWRFSYSLYSNCRLISFRNILYTMGLRRRKSSLPSSLCRRCDDALINAPTSHNSTASSRAKNPL